jgi:hypothetical protein
MTPVRQTLFEDHNSNCLQAALASVLDRPITDVPNFCEVLPDTENPDVVEGWFLNVKRWLDSIGYGVIYVCAEDQKFIATDFYCVACGASPREGKKHAVVGRFVTTDESVDSITWELKLYHDPHPSNGFLKALEYVIIPVARNVQS